MKTILKQIIDYICDNPGFVLISSITLIQISPIKINPWSALLNLIRTFLIGDLSDNLNDVRDDVVDLKKDFEDEKISSKRWSILNYANSCRHGVRHTRDEWYHAIDQLREYEKYVEEHNIENGVIEEEAKYLRKLYAERCENNDFLL